MRLEADDLDVVRANQEQIAAWNEIIVDVSM